ncbi:unnamed protein product [Bursaphelenchus xylophilus]|uniref:(pine wood nematode) hypothetical protein n=1 Tax=Bursaphelenchus xylophilus TaxID=6326 RepID=A0A1I7RK30_BURXY|nr:unnamed protein product [Bursaphelenchus xylophilus]CAG9131547.1 unnamed protein product [Bursaphelenchus xylophilus]
MVFKSISHFQLYKTYYGKGVNINILLPAIFYFSLMLFSYFGNGLIISATIINKNLHGSYNIFVSLACLGDIMHQSCHWAFFINMVSGNNFIPYNICFYIQSFFLMGATVSIMMTFFVGVDRFLGVMFPTFYRNMRIGIYIGITVVITAAFSLYDLYLALMHVFTPYGKEPVMCVIIDAMGGNAADFWFDLCVILTILDVLLYSAVYIKLRLTTSASDNMRKVFRSLAVMMVFVVVGWMLNAFVRSILLPYAGIPIEYWFYFADYFGLFCNIASSTNVIILYTMSKEYRSTFQSIIGRVIPAVKEASGRTKLYVGKSSVTPAKGQI